ncbi:MAG TPA: FlgO family outer membrane protein [Chitinophagaceae bacterium]|jgi:TolB-like protein|nr:FlgO family outer membrane protein [Chitinophagaceae bacterium]
MIGKNLIVFLFCLNVASFAQKVQEHSQVVAELVQKTEANVPAGKQFRIAVVPFVSSNSAETSKAFGEYLTESISGKLSEKPQAFKVLERQRLDAVFKENELMLSGMMKPSEALKIGQLLPLDALFSGTYTKLKTYVEVSGRLIDVTSGEIITSYSGRIKMTKNIKTLFETSVPTQATQTNSQNVATPANITIINQINPAQQTVAKSKEEICNQKVQAFKVWLEDLSTQEKINAAVNEGMKTPFDNQCGQLHYNLIYSLSRYHLYPSDYKRFLAATLDTIAFPTNDERAYEICRYWDDDKHIDEEEWRSGFSAMKKVGNYSLSSYVRYLIGGTDDQPEQLKDRINQLITLAINQKLGLPRPMTFNDAFFEVWEGLDKKQELRIYLYETFSKNLTIDGKSAPKVYSKLNTLYKDVDIQEDKGKVLGWLIRFFNDYSFEKAHEELYDFAFEFRLTTNESTNQRISKEYPAEDLKVFVTQCKSRFTEYAMLSPYNSQKEDRINFCVQNSIPVPGVIPTTIEADNILKGNNLDEQLRVMKLLVQMKEVSKTLEPTLVSLLDRKSLEDKEKMTEIQSLAVEVLGHRKTSNTKAIDRMIKMVTSYNYEEADRAKAALVEIGKPAVQPLVNRLQTTTEQDGGLRYQIILMLGKIGKDAKPAEATLKSLLQKTTNSDVRYIIEATLDAIK